MIRQKELNKHPTLAYVTIHLASSSGGPLSARRRENGGLKAAPPPSNPHLSPLRGGGMVRQKELNEYPTI
jgi:hypothetical protein